jgi:Fe-S cluster assembly protein SufD
MENPSLNKKIMLPELKSKLLSGFKTPAAGSGVGEIQKEAARIFDRIGFPSFKNEEWKYTNLSKFIAEDWNINEHHASKSGNLSEVIKKLIPENFNFHRLVFIDGSFREDLSIIKNEEPGLVISSFSEAVKAKPDTFKQYFGKAIPAEVNGLTALNTAFSSEGVFIQVPKGMKCQYPVHLLYISGTNGEKLINQSRNLIIIEEGASLDLVETWFTEGDSEYLSNSVSEIFAGHGAVFNHYRFQAENMETARQVNFTGVSQQSHSLVNNFTVTTGGQLVRNDLNYRLDDIECESHMYGLYIGSGSQHIDNHTLVDHAMPRCFSNEFYKGIMAGKSTGVFNGKIIVRQDAQKTNAYQSNKNVLLSDEAHVNTKPQLEIFANDVKCSHGATTGQLDEEALFYLRSRGIGKAEAKAMLTHAFAADVLENIKHEEIKEYATKLVFEKLNSIAKEQ